MSSTFFFLELTPDERLKIQEKGFGTEEIHATDMEIEQMKVRVAQREVESMMFDDSEDVISVATTVQNQVSSMFVDENEEKME